MSPKLLTRWRQMVKGQNLQNEWYDDAEGSSVDQNLVSRKPNHNENLQDLGDTVRHGRRERGPSFRVHTLERAFMLKICPVHFRCRIPPRH